VLITGGAGFIGSHLAEVLLDGGHTVTVLDDLSTGQAENLFGLVNRPRFDAVFDTVMNEAVVARLAEKADVIYHLAAVVGVRLVVDQPLRTIETNVTGTDVVLRAAQRRLTPVLVASTSEVYGKSAALPFREDGDLVIGPSNKARWGYAASKLVDEFLALAYWKEHGLPVVVTRFFNTVGPRQTNRYGMVLPTFVKQALAGDPITVHGDGTQSRCFTWIGDVVEAMTALVAEPAAYGEVFNIGNDEEIAIRDLAAAVRELSASASPIVLKPYASVFSSDFEDMARRVPDLTKVTRYVDWRPKVGLEEILRRTIDFWRGDRDGLTRASRPSPLQYASRAAGAGEAA
jgi:UDP-glucose 4-epimerase